MTSSYCYVTLCSTDKYDGYLGKWGRYDGSGARLFCGADFLLPRCSGGSELQPLTAADVTAESQNAFDERSVGAGACLREYDGIRLFKVAADGITWSQTNIYSIQVS